MTVHPRMRGEHDDLKLYNCAFAGSSPHARGTQTHHPIPSTAGRFIPACAGNTLCRRQLLRSAPVHPRMRGEHAVNSPGPQTASGSSPHARGTRDDYGHGVAGVRFIPACAGNTLPTSGWGYRTIHAPITVPTRTLGSPPSTRRRPRHRAGLGRQRRLGAELDQTKAVEINRHTPVAAAGVELETGIVWRGPSDYRVAVVDIGTDLTPDHLAHAAAVITDVDPAADLHQPDGTSAAPPRSGVLKHDDPHR